MTRRNFNVKTRSVVLLMVLTMSLYGTTNTSAGYWQKVQDDTFAGYTSTNGNDGYQWITNQGSGSGATKTCPTTSGYVDIKAWSGQGYGEAGCIYDTGYQHTGYTASPGKMYYAEVTLYLKGVASDNDWGSYAYLKVTVELYYTNGLSNPIVGTSEVIYDSNSGGDYSQSLTMTTNQYTMSTSGVLYVRVTVKAHAEDGFWGKTSMVDFNDNSRVVSLYHWNIYEYQSSNIG